MKTHAISALLVLGLVSSCGGDDASTATSNSTSNSTVKSGGMPAVAAKPELVAPGQRRLIELEGGVRIEVLAEGQGDVVAPGDEVALSLTLSYVPPPAPKIEDASAPDAPADDAKSPGAKKKDKKPRASKPAGSKSSADAAKSEDAQSSPANSEGAKSEADTPSEVAETQATKAQPEGALPAVDTPAQPENVESVEAAQASDASPSEAVADSAGAQVEPASTDAANVDGLTTAREGSAAEGEAQEAPPALSAVALDASTRDAEATAPAPEPLAAALEPVVVLSTKNLGTPIRARVGASSTLVPGLSRALVGLRQGTIAEITLPAELAYGTDGLPSAGIPPGTPLLARIEIREVKR